MIGLPRGVVGLDKNWKDIPFNIGREATATKWNSVAGENRIELSDFLLGLIFIKNYKVIGSIDVSVKPLFFEGPSINRNAELVF